jgi:hypothetical protein
MPEDPLSPIEILIEELQDTVCAVRCDALQPDPQDMNESVYAAANWVKRVLQKAIFYCNQFGMV